MSKPKFRLVENVTSYDEIVDRAARSIAGISNKHELTLKMQAQLLEDVRRRLERDSKDERLVYVAEHLEEQVARLITLDVPAFLGMTKGQFRESLQPIITKTMEFFTPPAQHPIMNGEFTCLLVLPVEWGFSHLFAFSRLTDSASVSSSDRQRNLAVLSEGGVGTDKSLPKQPYVLVGINGGRGLKALSFAAADQVVQESGFTYFSAGQYFQMLFNRPNWLDDGESAVVLGEKFSEGHLKLTARGHRENKFFAPDFVERSSTIGRGIGKPYYAKMIRLP